MNRVVFLEEHIKSLDKEIEELFRQVGFVRQNKSYAKKQSGRKEHPPRKHESAG